MPAILPSVIEGLTSGSVLRVSIGSGKSAPSGVDAIIAYNGLVMNNRAWIDSIIVTEIDGFSDPDIRDDRDVNPQEHGETAFESWYGGRTITMKGFIRAFTLDKLRDIEQGMKTAFLTLEEKALVIQGKTLESSVQIYCKKNAPMAWTEVQQSDERFKRDFMITLRASNPRFVSLEEALSREEFGIIDNFTSDTITAKDYKFISGEGTVKVESGLLKFTATGLKQFARQTPEFFQPEPSLQYDYTPKTSLAASTIGGYVKYIDANNNIVVTLNESGVVQLAVRVASTTNVRAMSYSLGSSPVSRTLGTAYRFKVELRGNVVWFYHGTTTEWKQTAKYELTFAEIAAVGPSVYSRAYAYVAPATTGTTEWSMDNLAFGSAVMEDEQVMTVVNKGIFESQPVYELIGPITAAKIHIAETNEELIFKPGAEVPAGDIWTIDVKEGTITNAAGESKFAKLDPTSDWPELIQGENHLRLSGEGMAPVISGVSGVLSGLAVRFRHSWF